MRNVLYHFTTKSNFKKIMKTNCLKISEKCGLRAVSLTRNRLLPERCTYLRKSEVMIVIDKDKLKCDYKITPFDFFSKYLIHGNFYKEAEELVKKDIMKLDKYMLEVVHLK